MYIECIYINIYRYIIYIWGVNNMAIKKENKLVYFNSNNKKEKEILSWLDSSFIGFSGLVKELLYKEILKDKNYKRNTDIEEE